MLINLQGNQQKKLLLNFNYEFFSFKKEEENQNIIDLFNSRCEYGHRCHIKEEDCRTFLEGLMLVMNYAIVYCWCECEVEEIPYDGFRQID